MLSFFPEREIVLALGSFELRWYGLFYVLSFYLAYLLLPALQQYRQLTLTVDDRLLLVALAAGGAVLGGRLGYVLFYESAYFWQHPAEIFALSQGGMSAHGGFLGVALVLILFAWRRKIDVLALADVIVVPVALGLMLGRVGNWINGELYVSNLAHAAAVGKNLLIAGAAYTYLRLTPSDSPLVRGRADMQQSERKQVPPLTKGRPGGVVGGRGRVLTLFLILYGLLRFLTEYWREQPWEVTHGLTRGQLLTLPILAAGVMLMLWKKFNNGNE